MKRGEIRSNIDVKALAGETLAFIEGAQLVWLLDPKKHPLVALYRSYFTRLAEALRP